MDRESNLFWTIFNQAFILLLPHERKAVNETLRLCEVYEIPFAEAIDLGLEDAEALPMDLVFSIKRADEMGVWYKIDAAFNRMAAEWEARKKPTA